MTLPKLLTLLKNLLAFTIYCCYQYKEIVVGMRILLSTTGPVITERGKKRAIYEGIIVCNYLKMINRWSRCEKMTFHYNFSEFSSILPLLLCHLPFCPPLESYFSPFYKTCLKLRFFISMKRCRLLWSVKMRILCLQSYK